MTEKENSPVPSCSYTPDPTDAASKRISLIVKFLSCYFFLFVATTSILQHSNVARLAKIDTKGQFLIPKDQVSAEKACCV